MTTRALDTAKDWRPCLGCGGRIWTDRCHRLCKKCLDKQRFAVAPSARLAVPVSKEMQAVLATVVAASDRAQLPL